MTTFEEGDRHADEDTSIGVRLRLRAIEERQRRIESKLDRLLWIVVTAAIGYALAVIFGTGAGPT
jgi:hypothetical protein